MTNTRANTAVSRLRKSYANRDLRMNIMLLLANMATVAKKCIHNPNKHTLDMMRDVPYTLKLLARSKFAGLGRQKPTGRARN